MTHVVVVDDDDDVRDTTVMLLQVLGHEASGHASAAGAVQAAADADVVLQDVHMPGMRIEEQLAALRGLPNAPPVILFSATVDVRELQDLPGAKAVLSKPFTAAELEQALDAALEAE